MATLTEVRLVDDVDGSAADETVQFGVDGRSYEIDLSSPNAARLREALATFVAAARKGPRADRAPARGGSRRAQSATNRAENHRIRDWARSAGFEVSDRGRIPAEGLNAYREHDTTQQLSDSGVVQGETADPAPVGESSGAAASDAEILEYVRSIGWKVGADRTEPTARERTKYEKDHAGEQGA